MCVSRTQVPIMPAPACALYSLQGATTDPGMVAHFVMPRRADNDIKWLIVYVHLSRMRSLSQLRIIALDKMIKGFIERCPPYMLAKSFERTFRDKFGATTKRAHEAKTALGW